MSQKTQKGLKGRRQNKQTINVAEQTKTTVGAFVRFFAWSEPHGYEGSLGW